MKILRTTNNGQLLHLRHVLALASHPAMALLGKSAVPVVVSVGGIRSPYDRSKYTQNPDPYIVIWDIEAGIPLNIISIAVANPSLKPITALKIWADGSRIVSSSGFCCCVWGFQTILLHPTRLIHKQCILHV